MRTIFLATMVGVLSFVSGTAHAAGSTSPGKWSVYGAADGLTITTPQTTPVTVQIEKGKKKTVLEIDATATVMTGTGDVLAIAVSVNGNPAMPLQPLPNYYISSPKCVSGLICVVHALYWMDLDAAEEALPGSVIGQPLNITATVKVTPASGIDGTVGVRARLVKK